MKLLPNSEVRTLQPANYVKGALDSRPSLPLRCRHECRDLYLYKGHVFPVYYLLSFLLFYPC